MNIDAIKNTLNKNFNNLMEIAPNIYRTTDTFRDKPYAVRYFDLNDNISSSSEKLNEYLEQILGEDYFDLKRPIELRWNNYLYFLTSEEHQQDDDFLSAKFIIESDREYARKFVITETELPKTLRLSTQEADTPPAAAQDLYSTWLKILNDQQLGYMLDYNLKAPEIVRKIGSGVLGKLEQVTSVDELNAAEQDAIFHPLQSLVKKGFRTYPKTNEFQFGRSVNLITGPNGHGKTSLLEAIEYLYCGSTYRNGAPLEPTHISATLYNSQEKLKINSKENNSKRLKARNLGWYGKNDVRGTTLDESFARFNFMDTDAAIRVSVEGTAEQLSEDITRIILGPEAGKASDQIQRIHNELEKQHKLNKNNKDQLNEKIILMQNEVDNLNTMTKQSDTLFEQLDKHLQTILWTDRPSKADDKSISVFIENLASTNHQCSILGDSNLEDLQNKRQKLESCKLSLSNFVDKITSLEPKMKTLILQKEHNIKKRELVEELHAYSGTDLLPLDQQQKELTITINGLRTKLPDLSRFDLIDDKLANLTLEKALSETEMRLNNLLSMKNDVLIRIEGHERSQTIIANLHDQLVATATKMLESSPDKDHCPLCHSKFEVGQLMSRIASKTVGDSTSLSADLRSEFETLKINEADLLQTKSLLTALINYCGNSSKITCKIGLIKFEDDKRKLSEYEESIIKITSKLTTYNKQGLKVGRLKELMEYLEITTCVPQELNELLQSLQVELARLTEEIDNQKAELDATHQQISALAENAGLSNSMSAATISKTIASEMKSNDQKIAAAIELARYLKLNKDFSAVELTHRITKISDIASKFITTRKQEAETNSRLQQLELQIKENRGALKEIQTTFKNLSNALKILSSLLTGNNSLENVKHELLANNASIISEIFSKIHLPNEYEINVEGVEIKLIHKMSGDSRTLKEVSTGQRAAFALSLFLTMNKTLGNGPRILLLDDPISHIDDINMLSFLDYLRELAIVGNRQIFFATPNAKLASLFRHKFKFLGDNEFKEIGMTR